MRSTLDSELWVRAGAGDHEAFVLLFDRHSSAIYNYCFRRVGNWSLAEDLTSIVFLEAWRHRSISLPDGKVLPWLYGVATNVVRNSRRSQRRHEAALRRLPLVREQADFTGEVDSRLDSEQAMAALLALLGCLPRRQQDVFALCVWQGLSYEDAALALDIPLGTVRSRLSRARAALRELIVASGHEEGGENLISATSQ